MPRRKILIVDDTEINRQILRRILRDEYEVLEAQNGRAALDMLAVCAESISAVLLDLMMPVMDGYEMLAAMRDDARLSQIPVLVTTGSFGDEAEIRVLALGANDFILKPYNPAVIVHRLRNTIKLRETASTVNALRFDKLTRLFNREIFFEIAAERIAQEKPGTFVLACFDVNNFKVINDQYGSPKGDAVLQYIAGVFLDGFSRVDGICCRVAADHFAILYPTSFMDSPELAQIRARASELDGSVPPVTFSIGRYIIDDLTLSVSAMYDRAMLAKTSVKGLFDKHIAQFDESMRERMLREQRIVDEMKQALIDGQFEAWLQPQYRFSTDTLSGAEALVRWRHPERGLVPPGNFIPVFEQNGFIYELDKNVWEQACKLQRKWIDAGMAPLPVSVNVSRYDVLRPDLFDTLVRLVEKYDISPSLMHLEITESAFAKSGAEVIAVVKRLLAHGFLVGIDDFGSGYSSLNTLKDVPASILKLDMRFLESSENSQRGGNILESVVRMAKWLGTPVVAEGVETVEQAEFLKSIGCDIVQGYLYGRPMPATDYEILLRQRTRKEPAYGANDRAIHNTFWDPASMDTLIFNSYVGGACIFEYHNGTTELLRVNEKYMRELVGADRPMGEAFTIDVVDYMDEANKEIMIDSIRRAIETDGEVGSETELCELPGRAGRVYLHTVVRVIARNGDRALLYGSVTDVTKQRETTQRAERYADQLDMILRAMTGGVAVGTIENGQEKQFFISDRFYELFGYTKQQYEEELPRRIRNLIHPDDLEYVVEAARVAHRTGNAFSVEYRAFRRDGRMIWVRCNGSFRRLSGIDAPVQITVSYDITAEKDADLSAEKHARMSQQETQGAAQAQLKLITDSMPCGLAAYVITGQSVRLEYFNNGFTNLTGYSDAEYRLLAKKDPLCLVASEDRLMLIRKIDALRNGETHLDCIHRVYTRTGEVRYLNLRAVVSERKDDEILVNAVLFDVTKQKRTEENLRVRDEEYRLAIAHSGQHIYRYLHKDRSIHMSEETAALFRLPTSVKGVPECILAMGVIQKESEEAFRQFYQHIENGDKTGEMTVWRRVADGQIRLFYARFSNVFESDGTPVSAIIMFEDVTEKKKAALDLQRQAERDGMTGVYNKTTVVSLISAYLAQGQNMPCTLLVIDLDRLKIINDTLGHDVGDRAIQMLAATLSGQFRQTDIVGRIGGDEFIVFFDAACSEAMLRSQLASFMRKLSQVMPEAGTSVVLRASIGIALGIAGVDTFETLFKKADTALYHVKRNGKNDYAFYTPDMELTMYEYQRCCGTPLWRSAVFGQEAEERLLHAVFAVHPIVISTDLTANRYYTVQCSEETLEYGLDAGAFDGLVEMAAKTFGPESRASFLETFSRDHLLAAYENGAVLVSHEDRQKCKNGADRLVLTDAVFFRNEKDDHICQIVLVRQTPVSEKKKDLDG